VNDKDREFYETRITALEARDEHHEAILRDAVNGFKEIIEAGCKTPCICCHDAAVTARRWIERVDFA
jgi:hypothetical protein